MILLIKDRYDAEIIMVFGLEFSDYPLSGFISNVIIFFFLNN